MTSITMASRCLDNLLPPGAQRQREADYLCLTVTYAIMYHSDGSTVNTTGVPSAPQPVGTVLHSYVFLTWWAVPTPACSPPGSLHVGGKDLAFIIHGQGGWGRGNALGQGQELSPILLPLGAAVEGGENASPTYLPGSWAHGFVSWGYNFLLCAIEIITFILRVNGERRWSTQQVLKLSHPPPASP